MTIIANPSVGEKCPVHILDLYISKLPVAAKEKDIFYCRALQDVPKDASGSWFAAVPIGKNTLTTMVSDMCKEAGVLGKKTNHSLRVSGATNLYAAGVPEKIIQSRTGHTSLEALRKYERISTEQEETVSKILTGEIDTFDNATLSNKEPIITKPTTNLSTCGQITSFKHDVDDSKLSPITNSSAPGVQYKDCVVNIYQTPTMMPVPPGPPPPVSCFPYFDYYSSAYYPPPPSNDYYSLEKQ